MLNNQQIHSFKNDHDEQNSCLQEEPLDPAVERVRKKLMRLMIFSISITIILILAVLVGIVYKVTIHQGAPKQESVVSSQSNGSEIANHTLTFPEKTQILSQSLSEQNIVLKILTPEGQIKFMIYNYRTGALIAILSVEITEKTS
ncbi:hypothetical protein [Bartonella sp. A05]|uniref:hypothetical protein n=1 Tax=Bartonella sp. A05 TaxID=2967261 RepID=UPI0022A92B7E|nr:hypothetical protein [Bartonella sp. A05]MCZ2203730.1 hypothetical protein [Bartonella sp. A05]